MSPVSLQGGVAVGGRRVPWEASMGVFSLFAPFFSLVSPILPAEGNPGGGLERLQVVWRLPEGGVTTLIPESLFPILLLESHIAT